VSVPAPEPSDRELLALLRARDQRGFDLAYARYGERIFGFLVRLARSRAAAEDLFQHTFLRLAEHGPSLPVDANLRAWLFAVARNAFNSRARAGAVSARLDRYAVTGASAESPASRLELSELESALLRLSADDRELLLLIGVEGFAHAEVASMLGIDLATLRKRVSRARARFSDMLDAACEVVPKSEVSR
jgi:RNA polymerase sigma-70 factor (ECF subfamily)